MELAFAGLQQLCAPLMDRFDDLPEPQREALAVAFGRGVGPAPDRFLVGLAVLSLMAAAASDQPVLCIVDDAQWIGQVSVQTLAFVARRLMAEPVAIVFAVRDHLDVLANLPELEITGLADSDARELLESAMVGVSTLGSVTASSRKPEAFRWRYSRCRGASRRLNSPVDSGYRVSARRRRRSRTDSRAASTRFRRRRNDCCSSRRQSRSAMLRCSYGRRRNWAFPSMRWRLPRPQVCSSSVRACGFSIRWLVRLRTVRRT